jgi:hypothetical protein
MARFNRLAGTKLTKKRRPLIERYLAECRGVPSGAAWASDKPQERAAQLFVMLVTGSRRQNLRKNRPVHRHFLNRFSRGLTVGSWP